MAKNQTKKEEVSEFLLNALQHASNELGMFITNINVRVNRDKTGRINGIQSVAMEVEI